MTISNLDLFKISNSAFPILDVNNLYISLLEMPLFFGYGNNSFLVGVKLNAFKKDTLLNIFFLDNHNNNIPVTVTLFRLKLYIRCFVNISSLHPIGNGKLIIIGVLSSENPLVSLKYKNSVNIKHQRSIYVNPNYKTPSVLRFYTNPIVLFSVDLKQLEKYLTITRLLDLPINSITVDNDYPGYFCLNLDKPSFNVTTSVYYLKFLLLQYITTSLSNAKSLNKLYSGSSFSQSILLGDYYGNTIFNTSVLNIRLTNGNFHITNSTFNIGGINPGVEHISGKDIDRLIITYSESIRESKTKTLYLLYVKNSSGLLVGYMLFDTLQRYSGSTQYLKLIDYDIYVNSALNLSINTNYFSGSIYLPLTSSASLTKSVYSLKLHVVSNSNAYGHYRDLDIKKVLKYLLELLLSLKSYLSYEFYGNVIFTSSGKTILSNCYVTDAYINLNLNNLKITFDTFTGSLYSKRLKTLNQYLAQRGNLYSFISGSLRGKGTLVAITSTIVTQFNSKLKRYSVLLTIVLSLGQSFTGIAYNVDLLLLFFTGSIKKGILTDTKDTKVLEYNEGINIKQAVIYGGIGTKVSLKNIQLLLFKDKDSINYPPTFLFDYGLVNILYSGLISFNKATDFTGNLIVNGNFLYTGSLSLQIQSFTGIYKPKDYLNLLIYSILNIQTINLNLKLFNTNLAYIFNNNYNKIYIPVGLSAKNGVNLDVLLNKIQNKKIKTKYTYLNILNKTKKLTNVNTIPLKITLSNLDIYSGYLSLALLYYNNTTNTKNYQLLSTFLINETLNVEITKSILLPKLLFVNQSNHFLLKYKDSKNRYCQLLNFFKKNNVSFDFLLIERTYNNTNTKLVQKDLITTTINGKSGDVTLTPYDLLYYSNDVPVQTYNVGKLFDTYIDSWQYDAGVLNSPLLFTSSNGNIIIGPGLYLVYSGEYYNSPLIRYSVSNYTTFSSVPSSCSYSLCILANGTTNYILFLQLKGYLYSTTNRNNIDVGHIIPVVTAYKNNNDIHMLDFFKLANGLPLRLFERFVRTRRFLVLLGTLIIGQTGSTLGATSSVITATSGYIWYGANRVPMTSSNSLLNNAKLYYKTATGWLTSSLSTYDNLHYNSNGTSLADLNPNKFNVNWIYRTVHQLQSRLIVVLSDKLYVNSGLALKSAPNLVPDIVKSQGLLIGRAVFLAGATSASVILSAFDTKFAIGGSISGGGGLTYLSFIGSDGIQGVVSNPTTTPLLQLWLDNITVSAITCSGDIYTNGQISSSILTGTSPFLISSNTLVNNLNAQYINGISSSQIPIYLQGIQNRVAKWDSSNKLKASNNLYDDGLIFTCSTAFTSSGGIYISSNGLQSIGNISSSGLLLINGSSSFKNNMSVDGNLTILQGHGLFLYSDRNLKLNIIKITNSLLLLDNINGIKFDWIKTKIKDYGMIAQLVLRVIPLMVFLQGLYKQINYVKLIPFLLLGIKLLNTRIKLIESKLNE